MKRLFTAKISKPAVLIALILLFVGFLVLSYDVPYIAPFSLAITGFLSLFLLFGKQGISYAFSKPQKLLSTYVLGLIGAWIFAGIGVFITTTILHSAASGNASLGGMNWLELVKTIPMLLGEELITFVLLLVIVNLLGGTRKALFIAIIVSALIFGFLHLPTYNWNFAQVIFIIAAARIPFTLASLRSDSMYTGLFVHITYDWIIFISTILIHR